MGKGVLDNKQCWLLLQACEPSMSASSQSFRVASEVSLLELFFFFSRLLFNLIWNLAGKASGCLRSVALVLWQLKSTYILVVIIIHMIFLPPLCWFYVLLWPINCDKCTGNYHSTTPAPYSGCYRVCCLAASAVVLFFLFSREPVISELQCVFNWLFP